MILLKIVIKEWKDTLRFSFDLDFSILNLSILLAT